MADRLSWAVNLRQLTYFQAVIEHGSLAAASEALGVAQPNLSVAIQQLEAEWGVALFERQGRGLAVTDTGRLLFERASQLLGGAAALDQEMRAIGRGFSARLRVGYTSTALDVIASMVARIREERGAVAFSLQQGEPRLLETMVEQRQLDFAITHPPIVNAALHVIPLTALELMLVVKADETRWRVDETIQLPTLAEAPLILLRRSFGVGIFERITEAFSRANIVSTIVTECTDASAVYSLIKRGVGFGVIPIHAGYEPPAGLRLHGLTPVSPLERLALVYPRGRRLLPAVQAAIELCRDLTR
jgi:LysR family transcriptional regulator, salicylic acid-responsive activator of bsdBCD